MAAGVDLRLSREVLDALRARHWSGNVRELRNVLERAAILARGEPIRPELLATGRAGPSPSPTALNHDLDGRIAAWLRDEASRPTTGSGETSLHERFLELVEAPLLRAALAHQRGNRAATAQMLGIHRATLRQKLRRYEIE